MYCNESHSPSMSMKGSVVSSRSCREAMRAQQGQQYEKYFVTERGCLYFGCENRNALIPKRYSLGASAIVVEGGQILYHSLIHFLSLPLSYSLTLLPFELFLFSGIGHLFDAGIGPAILAGNTQSTSATTLACSDSTLPPPHRVLTIESLEPHTILYSKKNQVTRSEHQHRYN